jgi:putative ABC transport system ATP-binding protein
MLRTNFLSFSYNPDTHFQFPDVELKDGQNLLVLGKSGIGKTTFLQLLAGIRSPESGKIQLNETVITNLKGSKLDKFRGQNIGIVFQQPYFVQNISVLENLTIMQLVSGLKPNRELAMNLLDSLNISKKAKKLPKSLSHGERQRASIALALVNKPALILADEPTSSLDDENCNKVAQLLLSQSESLNSNLVIITHDKRLKDIFPNHLSL